MFRKWLQWPLIIMAVIGSLLFLFQNCGPAKLSSQATSAASTTPDIGSTGVGSKVDLNLLLLSPQETASNVLNFTVGTVSDFDYAQSSPIIENIVLKNNDFNRIIWVHGPSSTIMAVGDAFNQVTVAPELLGNYYIFGYRNQTSYLIAQFRIVTKGGSTLTLNSVGAVQINQQPIESDSVNESILISAEAPAVDLTSAQFIIKSTGTIIDGRRAILVKKKLAEAVDVEVKLADMAGQSFDKIITLPSRSSGGTPSTTTTTLPPTTSGKAQILQLSNTNQSIQLGQTLTLNLNFNVPTKLPEDYVVFVAFVGADGSEAPFSGGALPAIPTSQWSGSMTMTINFPIPSNAAPGTYSIRGGMFHNLPAPNNTRISLDMGPGVTVDGSLRYTIGTLNVSTASTAQNTITAMPTTPLTVTGSTVQISYSILNAASLGEDELAFIHITDLAGTNNYVSDDFSPIVPTSTWSGNINFTRTLTIPSSLPNGDYHVRVGYYQAHSPWTRATLNPGPNVTNDGSLRYIIGKIHLAR